MYHSITIAARIEETAEISCLHYNGEDAILRYVILLVSVSFWFSFLSFPSSCFFFLSLSFCISIWLWEVIDQRDLVEFKGSLIRYAEWH